MSPARRASGLRRPSSTSPHAWAFLVVAVIALVAILLGRDACSRKLGQVFGVATDPGRDAGVRARDAGIRPTDAGRPPDDW